MTYIPNRGFISTDNSTSETLGISGTYSGTWEEITNYASISVVATSTNAATLYADFSDDASNEIRNVQLSPGDAGVDGIHSLIPVAKYFRVRIVNGGTSSDIVVQTLYHNNPRIAQPTSRVGQSIGLYSDVLNTRIGNDFILDTSAGLSAGRTVVHKFGDNPSVASSTTEDINFSGTITFQTTATTVRVAAGNAADAAAGAGARSVKVIGLDSNWDDAEETINTNGASAGTASSTSFIRVFRAYVVDVGTYTGANTGNVAIENSAGGTTYVTIAAGKGQTETSHYTVPRNKTAFITRVAGHVEASKPCDLVFWQRHGADVTSAPFCSKRLVAEFPQVDGEVSETFRAFISIPEKSDLWWTATAGSGGAAEVEVDYDLIIQDNTV
jgi:hypothetical protein